MAVVGFFDVNRISGAQARRLIDLGWVPVQGDPRRAIMWRESLIVRMTRWMRGQWQLRTTS